MKNIISTLLLIITFTSATLAQAPNGFYVGTQCELEEANVTYYLKPLKIEVDQPLKFIEATIHSSNNDNDLYRVSLAVEKVPQNTWLILKVDKEYFATCLRTKSRKRFGQNKSDSDNKISSDTTKSKGGFVIEDKARAKLIANFLGLEIINRKHFGHQISGQLKASKSVFSIKGPVILDFTLSNDGTVPVKLPLAGNWKDDRISKNFHFRVFHEGKKVSKKRKPKSKKAYMISEFIEPPPTFHPGDKLEKTIDLANLYEFEKPGTYTIQWTYKMLLTDMSRNYDKRRAPEFKWSDEVVGSLEIEVR